jgi:hypothetical protein
VAVYQDGIEQSRSGFDPDTALSFRKVGGGSGEGLPAMICYGTVSVKDESSCSPVAPASQLDRQSP